MPVRFHLRRVRDDAETEAPRHAGAGLEFAGLRAGELGDRFRFEDTPTVEFAAPQHQLINLRDISGGGKQARAAEGRSRAIRHRAAIHVGNGCFLQFFALRAEDVGARAALVLLGRDPPRRVFQAERGEQAPLHKLGEGHAAGHFDDAAERINAGGRVTPAAAGCETQRLAREHLRLGGERPMRIGRAVFAEAAGVREHIAQRDRAGGPHERAGLGRLLRDQPEVAELGQEFFQRIVEA